MPAALWISRSLRPRVPAVGALAFAASIAVHASALLARGHGPPAGARPEFDCLEILVDLEAEPRVVEITVDSEPVEVRERAARVSAPFVPHRHDYPTPPAHATERHDAVLVHPPLPSPAVSPTFVLASVVSAPPDEPARFVMRFPENGAARAVGRAAVSVGDDAQKEQAPFVESAVDMPARLLRSVPALYPDSARAAELEGDVELEIVVDGQGAVASARAVTRVGHGLEAAAVRALRGYRFSAALRQGRPVPVRMRWKVAFRLR